MSDSPLSVTQAGSSCGRPMRVLNAFLALTALSCSIVLIYVMNGQLDHDPFRNETVISDEALLALGGMIALAALQVALGIRGISRIAAAASWGVALASIPYGAAFLLPHVVDDPVVQLMNLTAIVVLNTPLVWANTGWRRQAGA